MADLSWKAEESKEDDDGILLSHPAPFATLHSLTVTSFTRSDDIRRLLEDIAVSQSVTASTV